MIKRQFCILNPAILTFAFTLFLSATCPLFAASGVAPSSISTESAAEEYVTEQNKVILFVNVIEPGIVRKFIDPVYVRYYDFQNEMQKLFPGRKIKSVIAQSMSEAQE